MTPKRNAKTALPASVVKYVGCAVPPKGHYLVLLLDGIPCTDVEAATFARFDAKLSLWKRCVFPSLARSDVRYFYVVKSMKKTDISEVTF